MISMENKITPYVKGLQAAARCLGEQVWVTGSLLNEAGRDNDAWLSADNWLEINDA